MVPIFLLWNLLNVLNISGVVFFVKLVITSAEPILLHFNIKKNQSCFDFSGLTTTDLFYLFFWGFEIPNTYTEPSFFVDRVQKCNCHLCISALTSKNISGTLFMICFCLNVFITSFSGILSWKDINHSDFVLAYTPNTRSTPFFFVYNC